MVNIGIIGHTGRLGKPLVEILNKHPYTDIIYTESRKEGAKGNLLNAELVFLALPEGESKIYLPRLKGKKIIDLSNDYRCNNNWIYGLPELNSEQITFAQQLTNPGCYATSIILGLAPLTGKVSNVNIASTSGISGAGIQVQEQDNFLVYKEGKQHKHILEIEKMLGLKEILFVPQRIDVADRGIISTIFADYKGKENLIEIYNEFYKSKPFVRVKDSIETKKVNGTNFCDIKISNYGDKIIVISALDNIIKGGAGQAVQNFNLMYGFDETIGLFMHA
ncbi:MAG: Asd/ArgC dimerization domain-containing protein [Nanoarchaeota archaeon]|nr:Asd/ArgC dimerization domain-containing protein [Nanoarchaeota archaeon]